MSRVVDGIIDAVPGMIGGKVEAESGPSGLHFNERWRHRNSMTVFLGLRTPR